MSYLYSNIEVRERAERLVTQDVIYCVSSLVSDIAQSSDAQEALGIDSDELSSLLEMLDWDEAASNFIDEMDRDDMVEYLEDNGVEVEDIEDGELRTLVRETAEVERGGVQAFCEDKRIDPERTESLEFWIVSNWLADKLEAKGHAIVRDFLGMTIWGRPTTGQAISMDNVILEIARDLLKS